MNLKMQCAWPTFNWCGRVSVLSIGILGDEPPDATILRNRYPHIRPLRSTCPTIRRDGNEGLVVGTIPQNHALATAGAGSRLAAGAPLSGICRHRGQYTSHLL